MKALWFLPFTFAAGAEGFALFAPYLLAVLTALHMFRAVQASRLLIPALISQSNGPMLDDLHADGQPAM